MFGMGVQELLIVGVVAVLLFGKRLPEVARSLGESYQEFRKGLNELQSEMRETTRSIDRELDRATRQITDQTKKSPITLEQDPDYQAPTAPKFEPQQQQADAPAE